MNRKLVDHSRSAFTLVELLVVIGIIALLISILLPSLAKARKSAMSTQCLSNQRQIVLAIQSYALENRNAFPGPCILVALDPQITNALNNATYSQLAIWHSNNTFYDTRSLSNMSLLQKYLGGPTVSDVWFCPLNDAVRNTVCVTTAGNGFLNQKLGFGYRINNGSSLTGCSPTFLFGDVTQSDPAADQQPKKLNQAMMIVDENLAASVPGNLIKNSTRVWLTCDSDARNLDSAYTGNFDIQIAPSSSPTTAQRNAYALQPVHRIGKNNFPKDLARNYAFLDGHAETLGYWDWPAEQNTNH